MSASGAIDINVWIAVHSFDTCYGEKYLDPIREMAKDFERAHP